MRINRRMSAYERALVTQEARVSAECHLGTLETYLYEARVAREPLAIKDAMNRVRQARRALHRAIDADRMAVECLRAIDEELDRKAAQRRALKARRHETITQVLGGAM